MPRHSDDAFREDASLWFWFLRTWSCLLQTTVCLCTAHIRKHTELSPVATIFAYLCLWHQTVHACVCCECSDAEPPPISMIQHFRCWRSCCLNFGSEILSVDKWQSENMIYRARDDPVRIRRGSEVANKHAEHGLTTWLTKNRFFSFRVCKLGRSLYVYSTNEWSPGVIP